MMDVIDYRAFDAWDLAGIWLDGQVHFHFPYEVEPQGWDGRRLLRPRSRSTQGTTTSEALLAGLGTPDDVRSIRRVVFTETNTFSVVGTGVTLADIADDDYFSVVGPIIPRDVFEWLGHRVGYTSKGASPSPRAVLVTALLR